jgi:hypothetical protein
MTKSLKGFGWCLFRQCKPAVQKNERKASGAKTSSASGLSEDKDKAGLTWWWWWWRRRRRRSKSRRKGRSERSSRSSSSSKKRRRGRRRT